MEHTKQQFLQFKIGKTRALRQRNWDILCLPRSKGILWEAPENTRPLPIRQLEVFSKMGEIFAEGVDNPYRKGCSLSTDRL